MTSSGAAISNLIPHKSLSFRMTNAINQGISELIPKSLDDIIRANREESSLSLSTNEELDKLPAIVEVVANQKSICAKLNNWRFVCLNNNGTKAHFLTGIHEAQNCVWGTSVIVAIDMKHCLALTRSGNIYQLGTKGEGEPETDILLHICAQFHKWGIGGMLGVPHVFY
jgi:hypothetical protein